MLDESASKPEKKQERTAVPKMRLSGNDDRGLTIAHVMPWSGIGGVEIATLRMTAATNGRFRNVAFCLADAHDLRERFEQSGVETIVYDPPTPSLRHGQHYYRQSRKLAQQLLACGADIVHFSDEKAAHHTSLAALLARKRMICHLRVSYPTLSWRQRLCLLPVDSFVFVSDEARRSFDMDLREDKVRVIYDSVAVPEQDRGETAARAREELGISEDTPVIGTVARVSAQKDYFTLADAAFEVLQEHPEALFLVVGDNSRVNLNLRHYGEVSARLKELGIEDRFMFTGHRDNVPTLIAAMDFCVLSTHREGFPLSILESMALGKPVIATNVGGIPEIVIDGVTGYLHVHQDSKGLAAAILRLLADRNATRQLGLSAREHVRKNFSSEQYVREITRAYCDVVKD